MCLTLHQEPRDTEPLAKLRGSDFDLCKRSWPFLNQSVRHHEFDCWYLRALCILVCVHVCACTLMCLFSIEGYFWGSNCVKYRDKFEPTNLTQNVLFSVFLLFFFVKSNFVAKCTCKNFALKWLSCRSRADASFSGFGEKKKKLRKRFEVFRKIVWGFTIKKFV